jgi:hypothetical protein
MTDESRFDADADAEVDPWVIPLHEVPPLPTSADAGTPPVLGIVGPGVESPPLGPADEEDELPTEGFHPRLRRSA